MSKGVSREMMRNIKQEVIDLTISPLYTYRKDNGYLPVVGEGDESTKILFIGEAPGRNEAKTGKPFCGAAGKILDFLLESIYLSREGIYITNIVKDRPPENRDPTPEEIEVYGPFLDRQIEIIKPKVIVTLGRYSMQYVMRNLGLEAEVESIGLAHGKSYVTHASRGDIVVAPQYHPAAAIYNRKLITILKEDFKHIVKYL